MYRAYSFPKEKEDNVAMETVTEEESKMAGGDKDERKDYHVGVLKHVQVIFAHLACSKLQYYVPRGFWKHFRYMELYGGWCRNS